MQIQAMPSRGAKPKAKAENRSLDILKIPHESSTLKQFTFSLLNIIMRVERLLSNPRTLPNTTLPHVVACTRSFPICSGTTVTNKSSRPALKSGIHPAVQLPDLRSRLLKPPLVQLCTKAAPHLYCFYNPGSACSPLLTT